MVPCPQTRTRSLHLQRKSIRQASGEILAALPADSMVLFKQFTGVVGTFVSSIPAVAALVWGSIQFTILAASNFTNFFDKLTEWFMKLQSFCPRYSEYQFLHPDSPRLQRALSSYYAIVVRFCTKAVQVIARTSMSFSHLLQSRAATSATRLHELRARISPPFDL